MKRKSYLFLLVMVLIAMFASACGAAPAASEGPSIGGSKPLASLVEFTGVIEAIEGNQWTVNGQVIMVEPSVISGAAWKVGDTVKVEAEVQADGSVVVTRVKSPDDSVDDNSNDDNSNDDNSNDDNSNDDNGNDDNSNDDNSNDDNSNDDDNGNSDHDDDSQNSNDDSQDNHNGNGNDDSHDDDNGNDDDDSNDDDDDDSNDNG